jgi:hypothetical protein
MDRSIVRDGGGGIDSSRGTRLLGMPDWVWDSMAYLPAFTAAPALALGLAGLADRGPRVLRERPWLSALVAAGGAAFLAKWQLERLFSQEPDYELERRIGELEIRRYAPRVIAETLVDEESDWQAARSEGFKRLANYIFGGNTRQETLEMTSPVGTSEERGGSSERLAMTSPVTTEHTTAGHFVTFDMPKERTLADLPDPDDARVQLRQTPPERIAALRFSGSYRTELIREKQEELLRLVQAAGLEADGDPMFAGYDAPSTLPFLRRVEVWVRLRSE